MQGANFIPKSDFGNCPFGRNLPQFSPGALSDGGNGPPSLPLARQLEEWPTADDKNPNKIQPGETEPGIYHYTPGNQSGKAVDINKPESEQENNVDRTRDRHPPRGERR